MIIPYSSSYFPLRYFIEVSYNGQAYHGWQIQPNAHTVQAEIQNALKKLCGQELEICGSGRTDSGVHAIQQFFHVDLPFIEAIALFRQKLNGILPIDIAVLNIYEVESEAHARYDAVKRSYQYHLYREKNPFREGESYYFPRPLDTDLMNEACKLMLGHGNFQSFSKVKTAVNNFECELVEAKWESNNEMMIFYVSANRFLRGMVRAMVGTLIEVGLGRMTLSKFQEVLESNDRKQAGTSVPAKGLFLTAVIYQKSLFKR